MTSHFVFAVNSNAGGGHCDRQWKALARDIRIHSDQAKVMFTSSRGDLAAALEHFTPAESVCVVSVGGDGTHQEVVTGVMRNSRRDRIELAFLPAGTGNDLCRSLRMDCNLLKAWEGIPNGARRAFDVGEVSFLSPNAPQEKRFFVNMLTAGVTGWVQDWAQRHSRRWGRWAYHMAGLKGVQLYEDVPAEIIADGSVVHQGPLFALFLANGTFYAGGLAPAPQADPGDGVWELVILTPQGRFHRLDAFTRLMSGRPLSSSLGRVVRCRHVVVRPLSDPPLDINADGEAWGRAPFEAVLKPHSFSVRGAFRDS